MDPELAAELRASMAAAERGETEDLGSFKQYLNDEDDEDLAAVLESRADPGPGIRWEQLKSETD